MSQRTVFSIFFALIKAVRPLQWVKNASLFAALLFSGFLFYQPLTGPSYFLIVTWATILFSILASSVYLINDVVDIEVDRHHPFKKNRPIASGALPVPVALFASMLGLSFVFIASLRLQPFFLVLVILYVVMQVLYAKFLKHIPILDVVTISTGFLIRIYAGAIVVNLHMSVWFLLTIISASLFLSVAKRQSELTLLNNNATLLLGSTRKILTRYSQRLLDQYTSMFATATWLTYALFAFQNQNFQSSNPKYAEIYTVLPKSFHSEKLLMLSLPFVIYGVMRYLHLIYEKNRGESPEKVLYSDKPIFIDATLFVVVVFFVIYVLG
ncbi:decaprenyl-phosphate phosphoribosyltransferase [Patescibacteria group bacterium]|nr:decaprenyl-phosphate phosphoribosyltransferase [Patescibacteria group bacterium]